MPVPEKRRNILEDRQGEQRRLDRTEDVRFAELASISVCSVQSCRIPRIGDYGFFNKRLDIAPSPQAARFPILTLVAMFRSLVSGAE